MKKKISIMIEQDVLVKIDKIIDNIIRNRSQAIEFLARKTLGHKRSAVILAGRSESKLKLGSTYKPLGMLNRRTVIEKAVQKLKENNFKEIYIIARHKVLTSVFDVLKDGFGYGVIYNFFRSLRSTRTTLKSIFAHCQT